MIEEDKNIKSELQEYDDIIFKFETLLENKDLGIKQREEAENQLTLLKEQRDNLLHSTDEVS